MTQARGQYLRLHDSLVATPQYRQAWRTAVSLATTVQQIPLVTAVQARLEPLAKPYVDTGGWGWASSSRSLCPVPSPLDGCWAGVAWLCGWGWGGLLTGKPEVALGPAVCERW